VSADVAGARLAGTDVLVIGAGGAGLRGAIAAADAGLKVLVVCKSLLGKAHTVMAEGGMAAALANVSPLDSWKAHFADTMKGGKLINNWRMAELHAKEAPQRVLELERWGAVFDRTARGLIHQRPFGAHTYHRLAHIGDRTGLELIRTLQDRFVHHPNVAVDMEVIITRLLTSDGRAIGALGLSRIDGRFTTYRAKAVILATGGNGRIYRVTSNSWESTGDGTALAYWAGGRLQDCEMVQFHPTGMVWPPGVKGLLVTEGVRGEGGILKNSLGERFMKAYDPERMDLSARDVVARAINSEVTAGRGSPHGGVFLDISHKPASFIKHKLPSMYDQFLRLGDVDITKQPMEVAPTTHYQMGGVRVEAETCATDVKGLFAAGEVACGLHGANRLGGNSLSDLVVFGKRAGDSAAQYALEAHLLPVSAGEVNDGIREASAPLTRIEGENPFAIYSDLQDVMTHHAPIIREEAGLRAGLEKVLELKERAKACTAAGPNGQTFNPGWHAALCLPSMLLNAEAIIRCAIERRESRGAHARSDYPELSNEMGRVNFTVSDRDGQMRVDAVPIKPIPDELMEVIGTTFSRDYVPQD
jgi:succinate dehydrogenase / fumarate reductase flavoprotein subunit